jgi:CHAT domain-containing protein
VFEPAMTLLDGASHLLVVLDAALTSVPFGTLVTEPVRDGVDGSDYKRVPWLARRYAVSVLPSVSSLRALRVLARSVRAPSPFVGIGDPVLQGPPGGARGVKLASLFRGGVADVDSVRRLPPLPDTADELKALARAQGASENDLFLGAKATETSIKAAPLDQYRTIAFATHGLVAGELSGLSEPALVLTPPQQTMPDDDGLLTASEITQLKLNADWVIMSACNTASGDQPGGEGLSGLAKAFFYAGSRALIVSHWPVASMAAVRLTTGTFEAIRLDPQLGRAEALRRAQMALLDDPSLSIEFTHPLIWAPFVIVGEGGGGR